MRRGIPFPKNDLGGAGLGAAISGIAGGGEGGCYRSTVGAAGKTKLKIPAETRLESQLMSGWKIQ